MRSVAGLQRLERGDKPADIESLSAGAFCETCALAVFPEDEELGDIGTWLEEHLPHGTIWAVVETEGGDVVTTGKLEREH
ncbi:MAG TPA: hypothetical protein VFA98_02815 [Thermoanaerobaculia bacterium]|jgi:hypothetical protein|nr:hypothetical protein [Thermoanaerobaculia bacterium]